MRLSCVFIGCLVFFTCCSQTQSEYSEFPDRCCFSFTSRRIPVNQVESYHGTHLQCNRNGVILVTKAQLEICAVPAERWVQRLMRLVDTRNSKLWPKDEIDTVDTKAKNSFRATEAAPLQQPQETTLVLKESHDWKELDTTQAIPNNQREKESVATRGTTSCLRADETTLVHLKESHDRKYSDTTKANPNKSAYFCMRTEGE